MNVPLQESIMDFYWHYSSKEIIDPAGKVNFLKAIGVASQVFNTLSEVIQGPCTLNQQALAHSRSVIFLLCVFLFTNSCLIHFCVRQALGCSGWFPLPLCQHARQTVEAF